MPKANIIVVSSREIAVSRDQVRVTFGVWIDRDALAVLALKASRNKGRKAKDGPVHVEVHSIEPSK